MQLQQSPEASVRWIGSAAGAAAIMIGEAHGLTTLVIEHGKAGQGSGVHRWFSSSVHSAGRQVHHVVLVARLAQELPLGALTVPGGVHRRGHGRPARASKVTRPRQAA